MPTARCNTWASNFDDRIYVFGGEGKLQPLSVVEEFTPDGWPFAVSPEGKLPTTGGEVKSD